MTFHFRPATRQNTPLIIGLAGPTKSGKTYSALRLAGGLAPAGGRIVMLNAEGARGHQYAEKFKYTACDLVPPFRPEQYTAAVLEAAAKQSPAVLIIDSVSHMHDGPGGMLEYHDSELDRMAKDDQAKRQRMTWAAWIKPKAAENAFIYAILGLSCPTILCMRAKEKIKIVPKQDPIDLGWQPIVGDRVAFETIFTLVLPPHSKGKPDLSISDMREPFDTMVPKDTPIDEALGRALAAWAAGAKPSAPTPTEPTLTIRGQVESVNRETGKGRATGRPWTVDEVTLNVPGGDPAVLKTRESGIGDRAKAFEGTGEVVEVECRVTEKGLELLQIHAADQPA